MPPFSSQLENILEIVFDEKRHSVGSTVTMSHFTNNNAIGYPMMYIHSTG